MLRIVAALLLFALVTPLVAADSEHGRGRGRGHDGERQAHESCKDSCTESEPEEPAAEPTSEDPAPEPTAEPTPEQSGGQSGDSKPQKESPIGDIKILGLGGPGTPGLPNSLPIPSCEPWLMLDGPEVRPECLIPSSVLK